jgi:hypothetical protein
MKMRSLVVGLVVVMPAFAADPPKKEPRAYTDAAKAGPDFDTQGEYAGPVPGGKAGIQVTAEGDGKFACRVLKGGLPGDGWDGTTQIKFSAKREDGKVPFEFALPNGEKVKGDIADGKVLSTAQDGTPVELKRIVRHSPTEGTKPPAGALVLFDGKNADEWLRGKLEDGLLSVAAPNGLVSKRTFGDCTLHVEFRLPFMPKARGQARGNSGVYLQGRYEVQVLDSFGLAGKADECGGIYSLGAPKVNMCYPPLQWQTYDIDYTAAHYDSDGKKTKNARISVRHNGVLIQDDFEITKDTTGGIEKEVPGDGPIYLQNHGDPVVYRNIWIVEKR